MVVWQKFVIAAEATGPRGAPWWGYLHPGGAAGSNPAGSAGGDEQAGAAHRLEPDRARGLAAHRGLEPLRHPRGASGRRAAGDRRDPLARLVAERLAGTGQHLGERLAAADAEQLDVGGLA